MSAAKKIIDALKVDLKNSLPKVNPTYLRLVELFPLHPISSKNQHQVALKVIERLISATQDEKSLDEGFEIYLTSLANLVSAYENEKYKASSIRGAEMLSYLMDLQGLKQSDLAKELGGQPIVSKILNGERELNLRQVRALAKRFKVSPEVFID